MGRQKILKARKYQGSVHKIKIYIGNLSLKQILMSAFFKTTYLQTISLITGHPN